MERSRRENEKFGDERQQRKWQLVSVCGLAGAILAAFVLEILFCCIGYDSIMIQALNLVSTTACGAMLCCMAVVAKRGKKLLITLACIEIVAVLLIWVLFALSLAGIEI